jgi:tetratricopeptide (TPR) repeat protein
MLPLKDDTKISLSLAGIVLLVYFTALYSDFSFIDDPVYIYKNPLVTGFKILDIFSKSYFAAYIPVTILSYAIEYIFFGENPFGYHLINLIFHAFNVILVYLMIFRLTKDRFVSFFTAMVFAIHPLQVQTVVWLSERKSILSFFFMIHALWYYIDFKEDKSGRSYAKSLIFFLLSILSKPISVTFFMLLICYDNFILKEKLSRTIPNKVPFIVISVFSAIVTVNAQSAMGAVKPYHGGSFYTNLITIPKALLHYFKLIFYPKDLLFYYDLKPASTLISPAPLIGIIVILLLIFIMIRARKERGIISFGIAMFFIFLLPVSNIIPILILTADRYMYIPIIGLSLSLISFLNEHISRYREEFYGLALFTFVLLSSVTISDSLLWKEKEGIWEEILKNSPKNMRAINNLVELNMGKGSDKEAFLLINTGLDINANDARIMKNYALYLNKKGNRAKARDALKLALKNDPDDKELYLEIAKMDYDEKDYESALKALKEGMNVKYEFPLDTELKYRFVLANIYVKKIMFDEAIREFKAILDRSDQYNDAKVRYGILVKHIDDFNKLKALYIANGKEEHKEKLYSIFLNLNLKEEGEKYLLNLKKSKEIE